MRFSFPMPFLLVITILTATTVKAQSVSSLSLDAKWLAVKGISQPLSMDETGVVVNCQVKGQEKVIFLPFEKDTYIWKDDPNEKSTGQELVARDNRYAVVLAKVDLSKLPSDAVIFDAHLQLTINWVQQQNKTGEFSCTRILTPWTEQAIWTKPDPAHDTVWNGMTPGQDYAPNPFASTKAISIDTTKGPQHVDIPGFADAVKAWRDKTWPNQGFAVAINGPCLQVNFHSHRISVDRSSIAIGGVNEGAVLLIPNLPLLDRLLLKPADLLAAYPLLDLRVVEGKPVASSSIIFSAVHLSRDGQSIDANASPREIASIPVSSLAGSGPTKFADVSSSIRKWLISDKNYGLKVSLGKGSGSDLSLSFNNDPNTPPKLQLSLPSYALAHLLTPPFSPRAGVYTKVKDGHLFYGGRRLRLWGVVGDPDPQRLIDMGFNAQRVWTPDSSQTYTPESAKKGEFAPHTKGDGSDFDKTEKRFADLEARGVFIMFAATNDTIPAELLLDDDSFVAGGVDWADWKAAVRDGKAKDGDFNAYIFADQRLQEIKKRHAKNLLTHVNPYTAKPYGQDEAIAIYEVFNENGANYRDLGGDLAKWNPFFLKELQVKWNGWLQKKYQDDAGLVLAWGSLRPGESIANSSVALAPTLDQHTQYPKKRTSDFLQFRIELVDAFNQDFRAYCRTLAPPGVGVNVVPFSFDTMFRPNLDWTYTQSLGDVNSFGMYFWNIPSSLSDPPSAYNLDSATVENKPSVLYETNMGRPSPYRSEFPLKLVALATYEDWDGAFFHYWGPDGRGPAEDLGYLTGIVYPPVSSHYWMAVHHEMDPVMCSSMMMAGQIFLHGLLPPASKPAIIEAGKNAIFSYDNFRGLNLSQQTFTQGTKIRFFPNQNSSLTVNGGPMPEMSRIHGALASGDFIKWDWPNSRLIIDSPTVKAYVGKISGPFRFSDGITLDHVSTPWICFSMISPDGTPLAGKKPVSRILMNGVYEAVNTGFKFNYDVHGGPLEQAAAVSDIGHEPVLVTPVEYDVFFPSMIKGILQTYDFALRETRNVILTDTNKISQRGPTPFVDILSIESRGGPAELPLSKATIIPVETSNGANGSGASSSAATTNSAAFLPEIPWDSTYAKAHETMRDSSLIFSNISAEDMSDNKKKQITINSVELPSLNNNLADVGIYFGNDRMTSVEITFRQAPSLPEITTAFSKELGKPVDQKLEAQYGNSRVHWTENTSPHDVLVTESQGTMKILVTP
jgi:hypothetical protein